MKHFLTICFALSFLSQVSTQVHTVKFNATFVATNRPIGGVGYELAFDSSRFSFSLNLEVGRYAQDELSTQNSSISGYSLTGLGLMPEARHYFGIFGEKSPLGFFASGFGRARLLKEITQHGITPNPTGFQFDSPSTEVDTGMSYDIGMALGYKTPGKLQGLHVEAVLGYGISKSRLFGDTGFQQHFIRFDLFLCGILTSKKTAEPEDFVW
ncbi:MAG: hypothetical protein SH856_00255 [Flavobacteriales bacterium]|nr:hypothetical protein [Flavobacteriales bacterium]